MKYTAFEDFYWLCGSSRAGKTTTSNYLEEQFGFFVYHIDDEVFGRLWNKDLDSNRYPTICKLINNENNWEAYYSRPIEDVIEETHTVWKENWPLVLNDIKKIKTTKPVLIEGGGLYPEWVSQVAKQNRIHYYIPSKSFQRELFVEGMQLNPGEEPEHEGQFFHAYKDTDFIVDQRIEHHDSQARHMKEQAIKLGVKYNMVESHDDFKRNLQETLTLFNLVKGTIN